MSFHSRQPRSCGKLQLEHERASTMGCRVPLLHGVAATTSILGNWSESCRSQRQIIDTATYQRTRTSRVNGRRRRWFVNWVSNWGETGKTSGCISNNGNSTRISTSIITKEAGDSRKSCNHARRQLPYQRRDTDPTRQVRRENTTRSQKKTGCRTPRGTLQSKPTVSWRNSHNSSVERITCCENYRHEGMC